jgi:hypothetical protein
MVYGASSNTEELSKLVPCEPGDEANFKNVFGGGPLGSV